MGQHFIERHNNNMAPKVSIKKQFSKTHHENIISFKCMRRRKSNIKLIPTEHQNTSLTIPSIKRVQSQCNLYETTKNSKSVKHRWKLSKSGCDDATKNEKQRMTNCHEESHQDIKCFQPKSSQKNLTHNVHNADKIFQRNNTEINSLYRHVITQSYPSKKSTHQQPHFHDKKQSHRRDYASCRRLQSWATASGIRKLLPIFILVNMLPFLYAVLFHGSFYNLEKTLKDK
ncbi:CLUMA_CG018834, isoform A [Clunio marinus]|uniref:CLUMA_CG018834, isoform A n=1 Tax=Clunio marinus TaxID=568069 RepID=A0A1J1J2X3_9DIPT|nr:CLUMA_CG018834, isoform A [Clunio marinus]